MRKRKDGRQKLPTYFHKDRENNVIADTLVSEKVKIRRVMTSCDVTSRHVTSRILRKIAKILRNTDVSTRYLSNDMH